MKKFICGQCSSVLSVYVQQQGMDLGRCSNCERSDWREVESEPDILGTVAIPEVEQGKADFEAGRTRRVSVEELTVGKSDSDPNCKCSGCNEKDDRIEILNDIVKTTDDLMKQYRNWWQCSMDRLEGKDAEIVRLKHAMSDVAIESTGRGNEPKFKGMMLAVFTRATGERCALIPTKVSVYEQNPHNGPKDVIVQEDGTGVDHIVQGTFEDAVAEVDAALQNIPSARAKKEDDSSPPKDDPEGSFPGCTNPVWDDEHDYLKDSADQFVKSSKCSDCGVPICYPELQCTSCFRKRVAHRLKS